MTLRETMTIKFGDIWQYHIGTKVVVLDTQYLYVGKCIDGIDKMYNYETGLTEYTEYSEETPWDDELDVLVVGKDMPKLIEVATEEVLGLIQDGWTLDSNTDKYIDVPHAIAKVQTLVKLQEALDG